MKRSLIIIVHMLGVLLAIAGLSILYVGSPNGYGISWTQQESYEETPQFAQKVNTDIGRIKDFLYLRDAFEAEGDLAMDNTVADMEVEGTYQPLTLREAIASAQKFGCYLDPKTHDISISSTDSNQEASANYEVKVTYKYYDPHYFENVPQGPGVGVTNIRELSIEVMRELSEYYHLKERYVDTRGNLYFYAHYMDGSGEYQDFSNTDQSPEELLQLGKYVYVQGDSQHTESNIDPIPESALDIETEFNPNEDENEEYTFLAAVDTSYPYEDSYRRAARSFEGDVRNAYLAVGMLSVGLLVCLVSIIMILRFDGYENREEALALRPADKLPYEIYLLLCVAAAIGGCFLMSLTGLRIARTLSPSDQWNYWKKILYALVIYAVAVYGILGTIRRARKDKVFRNTLIYGLITDLNDYAAHKSVSGTLLVRYGLFVGWNLLMTAGLIWLYLRREAGTPYLVGFAGCLAALVGGDFYVFHRIYGEARQRDSLEEVLNHLSEGDTDYEVKEEEYSGREQEIARRLNHISTGMRNALTEQVKSERLKADLITNVSHDIRTPLTSIINYVDLLKREDIRDPKVREYIDILDKKSARLKNLTEDLLEASKASSGNIRLDMQKIDLVELGLQAGAEFEDKFAAKGLELCMNAPEHPVYIRADGRHLWRVLENLYNNAAKYSMEHTRIYADILEQEGKGIFTLKNISANKLNISPDELTERFVRGDVSRTTDGSGLGLSIAKSLASLQGGELVIEIDGDLYKANVIFPLYEEPAAEPEEEEATTTT